MVNEKKLIYSWISFHGISDILLPPERWIPIYSVIPFVIYIPINILNFITIFTSALHFSQDLYFMNYFNILLSLFILLYFGEYKWSQYFLIAYMSIIHVPLHLYNINYDYDMIYLLILTYTLFYNLTFIQDYLNMIIESGGRRPNNIYHKLLLGVINAHIILNI
jgi:hypothetical protein